MSRTRTYWFEKVAKCVGPIKIKKPILTKEQLKAISSSLGNIRFHIATGSAANDELFTELTKKLAA